MRHRLVTAFVGTAGVTAIAIWISAGSLAAQQAAAPAPARAAAAYSPPRLADGHPDLQGTFNVATITPLERPAGTTNLVLTPDQAAALENYEKNRNAKNLEPSKADRSAPPVGGSVTAPKSYIEVLELGGGGPVGGYNTFWLAGGTNVITVNGEKRSSIVVDPADGHIPAMKADARRRSSVYLATAAAPDAAEGAAAGPPGQYDGPELRPLAERCLLGFGSTSGPPTLPNYFYNNLKQIVQTPDTIMILNEMVHDNRIVRMNAKHLPSNIRQWMGDSVGHWEGDTLVIDTTNFTGKTQFSRSSENLHVVERITRVAPNALLYRFTVDDPSTWDRAWTGEYPWIVTNEMIYEYACHEGNYALGDVLRGARLSEAEAAAAKKAAQK